MQYLDHEQINENIRFLEQIERQIEQNPIVTPQKIIKRQSFKCKTLNICKWNKIKSSKLYKLHKLIMTKGL